MKSIKYRASKKASFTLALNEVYAEKIVSPDKIKQLKSEFEQLKTEPSVKVALNRLGLPINYIQIRGSRGETACIEKAGKALLLCLKYDLALTIDEQRSWVRLASGFFKPCCTRDIESAGSTEEFKRIVKKPYKQSTAEHYDPDRPNNPGKEYIYRTISHAHKSAYASQSERPGDMLKRDAWIRKRNNQLRGDSSLNKFMGRCYRIQEELQRKTFGTAKTNLSIERIKAIIYSRK